MVKTSASPTSACTRGRPPNCATSAATTPTPTAAPATVVSNGVHALLSFGWPLGIVTVLWRLCSVCVWVMAPRRRSDDFGEHARGDAGGLRRNRAGAGGESGRFEQPPGVVVVQLGEGLA